MVICRPGSGGGEAAPTVCIQGHIDMVTEKNDDSAHDFFNDPIRFRMDGEWLKATGTTLGADNGIGVAAALALLDQPQSAKLPPLECLFTVDEETGLTGAKSIDPQLVTARTMLNLDTEEWGEVCIGCAGGGDCTITFDVATEPAPAGFAAFTLRLDGLLGGHSGLNINEDRGNATQLLCRVLLGVTKAVPAARVVRFDGGDKRNAIAREASAQLLLPPADVAVAREAVAKHADDLRAEYGLVEEGLALRLTPSEPSPEHASVMVPSSCEALLRMTVVLPHGVIKKSHAIEGLVETSNNVASLKPAVQGEATRDAAAGAVAYTLVTTTRSSLGASLELVRSNIEAVATMFGAASVEKKAPYPGWAPDLASRVLQVTLAEYRALLDGKEAHVGAVHAGLECGLLGEKFGEGMQMVSFGPTIRGAHSPDERVLVSTVKPFFDLTLRVCNVLAEER